MAQLPSVRWEAAMALEESPCVLAEARVCPIGASEQLPRGQDRPTRPRLELSPLLFHRRSSPCASERASADLRGSCEERRQVAVGPAAAVAYRAPKRRCLCRQGREQGAVAQRQALELVFPEL